MSGYKGEEKIDDFIRKIKGVLLWKPLSTSDLLDAVRLVLETTAKENAAAASGRRSASQSTPKGQGGGFSNPSL
jgi:hypothetical protein